MGWLLRSTLPATTAAVTPRLPPGAHSYLHALQQHRKSCYKHASLLPPLQEGDKMWMGRATGWVTASIMETQNEPHSDIVKTPQGESYRRNRKPLRLDYSSESPHPATTSQKPPAEKVPLGHLLYQMSSPNTCLKHSLHCLSHLRLLHGQGVGMTHGFH